jgi:hypothetical protein
MTPSAQAAPPALSAASVLQAEITALGSWLTAQGVDLRDDRDHAHEGSRDRLYWRYGYFMGLKQALETLTGHGATLH